MKLVYSLSYDQHQYIIEFEIGSYPNYVVVSFFYFLGKWSNLTNIFQVGWNHQLATYDHQKYVDINFQIDEVTRSNIQSCHAEVAPIHWPTSGHFMMKQGWAASF